MDSRLLIVAGASLSLVACGQSGGHATGNVAVDNGAAVEKKHAYCFFKDDEMRGWSASRDAHGNISIRGEAHVKDPRYKASAGKIEVGPTKAVLLPTISENDTGYATPDNWWHVSAVMPGSSSVDEAQVQCGDKVIADLKVPVKS